jgi:hypothetical protein
MILIAVLVLAAGLFFFARRKNFNPEIQARDESRASIAAPSAPSAASPANYPSTSAPQQELKKTLVLPNPRDIRAQAAQDPEAPSSLVIQFSLELSKKLQIALQSEENAQAFFPQLQACALELGKDNSASARVLCLNDAHKLAKKYPSLRPDYETLENRADPHTVKMRKFIDSGN